MDKSVRELMGISLEINRMTYKEKEISISEYLIQDGVPFCHYATYQKLVAGEYNNDDLYLYMLNKMGLKFDINEKLYEQLNILYTHIKKDIEFIDKESLATHLEQAQQLMKGWEDVYPHKIDRFILDLINKYFLLHEILNDKEIKVLFGVVKQVSPEIRPVLIYLIYFNTHKKRTAISSLQSVFESLPLFNDKEMLILLVITRQMIYEKEYNVALNMAKMLEETCRQTDNYSRMSEVYQDMIAIYGGLTEIDKVNYYMAELKKMIADDSKVCKQAIVQSNYYLGMCSYNTHNFEEAYKF